MLKRSWSPEEAGEEHGDESAKRPRAAATATEPPGESAAAPSGCSAAGCAPLRPAAQPAAEGGFELALPGSGVVGGSDSASQAEATGVGAADAGHAPSQGGWVAPQQQPPPQQPQQQPQQQQQQQQQQLPPPPPPENHQLPKGMRWHEFQQYFTGHPLEVARERWDLYVHGAERIAVRGVQLADDSRLMYPLRRIYMPCCNLSNSPCRCACFAPYMIYIFAHIPRSRYGRRVFIENTDERGTIGSSFFALFCDLFREFYELFREHCESFGDRARCARFL